MNRGPVAEGEWYHCYNRGTDKRRIFNEERDYDRFLMLLYLANSNVRLHVSDIGRGGQGPTLDRILEMERGDPLVAVGAYSLMPNHFHLLLRPAQPGGVALFMQKVSTGYSMYFNKIHERTGTLFEGKFKSKHVSTDNYFRRLVNYIHANAAELYDPGWKQGIIKNEKVLKKNLLAYRFSSLAEYQPRSTKSGIVDTSAVEALLDKALSLDDLIEEARIFAE